MRTLALIAAALFVLSLMLATGCQSAEKTDAGMSVNSETTTECDRKKSY